MTRPDPTAWWRASAEEWDAFVGAGGDPIRRLVTGPALRRALGDVRGKLVLDAGCGNGVMTLGLAAEGATVMGVDVAEGAVLAARRRADAMGLPATYAVGAVEDLAGVADASCDVVVSHDVLTEVEALPAACRALRRVLRPGGLAVVVLTHPCFHTTDVALAPDRLTLSWPHPYLEGGLIRANNPAFSREHVSRQRPLAVVLQTLLDAGFALERVEEPAPEPVAPDHPEHAPREVARWLPLAILLALRCRER